MSTLSAHTSRGGTFRRTALATIVAGLAAVLCVSIPQPAPAQGTGYRWPVKPFDREHPIRANFGDPRTSFNGPRTPRTLATAGGIFQFHFGIDISTADRAAVYPVRSGVASLLSGRTVAVDSGGGQVMEYWHIVPSIKPGQHVVAYKTVLGHVMHGYRHVHFTEREHGEAVNPLAPGHLTPYHDSTKPVVQSISFRTSDTERPLPARSVHGRVAVIAQAFDTPPIPDPWKWAGLPVAPALLTWRVERASDGKVVVPRHIAFDVRRTLPHVPFWSIYVRGTRQNASDFDGHKAWKEPGIYLYNLTSSSLDTTRLADGTYRLVVTATDIRGNAGSAQQVFDVRNGADL